MASPRGKWKDYIDAVVGLSGTPVLEARVPTERKTGAQPVARTTGVLRARDGGLDLVRRAA